MSDLSDVRSGGTRARRIIRNFGFLALGKVGGDASFFVLLVVVSRFFGQKGVGQYSFAIAFTGLFAVLAGFGLYPFTVKELSKCEERSLAAYFGRIFALRLTLSIPVLTVLLWGLRFLPFAAQTKTVMAIVGVYQIVLLLISGAVAVYVAREAMQMAGFLEALHRAVAAVAAIGLILLGRDLVEAMAALPIVAAVYLVCLLCLLAYRYGWPHFTFRLRSLFQTAREAAPYAGSVVLSQVYTRTDVVLLGFLASEAAAGIYNVGYRVVFLLLFIPHLGAMTIFPLASRLFADNGGGLHKLYHQAMNWALLFAVPLASGLWLVGPDVLGLFFGPEFDQSASVLRILTGLLFLGCLSPILGVFLMASDRQIRRTKDQALAAGTALLGNLLLIPLLGVNGAAWAAVITELTVVSLFARDLVDLYGWPRVRSRLAIGGAAAAIACLPFALLPSIPTVIAIPGFPLAYAATLVLFRQIRQNELRVLWALLRN